MAPHAIRQGAEPAGVEDAFIELANRLADAAAEITTKYFRQAHGPTSVRISCMATYLIGPVPCTLLLYPPHKSKWSALLIGTNAGIVAASAWQVTMCDNPRR